MNRPTNTILYKWLGQVNYRAALNLQQLLVENKKKERLVKGSSFPDLLLLLEHPPTYTEGRRCATLDSPTQLRLNNLGAEYMKTKRGGQTTFHGPGQLVGYPILDLKLNKLGIRVYVEKLEQCLMETCSKFNLCTHTTEDTGVWIDNRKLAAIGIQVQRYITFHGFALNCNVNLDWFTHIVPCGLRGKGVTSLTHELAMNKTIPGYSKQIDQQDITAEQVVPIIVPIFGNIFNQNIQSLEHYHDEELKHDINQILNLSK